MKTFFTIAPRQQVSDKKYSVAWEDNNPIVTVENEEKSDGLSYIPVDCDLIYEKPTCWPVLPLINKYVKEGENFRIIVLTATDDSVPLSSPENKTSLCHVNCELLRFDANKLCEENNLGNAEISKVEIPLGESNNNLVFTLRRLMEFYNAEDTYYFDISYGTKVFTICLSIFIHFLSNNGAYTECVSYGEAQWSRVDDKSKITSKYIYDITRLFIISDLLADMSEIFKFEVDDQKVVIDGLISEE